MIKKQELKQAKEAKRLEGDYIMLRTDETERETPEIELSEADPESEFETTKAQLTSKEYIIDGTDVTSKQDLFDQFASVCNIECWNDHDSIWGDKILALHDILQGSFGIEPPFTLIFKASDHIINKLGIEDWKEITTEIESHADIGVEY